MHCECTLCMSYVIYVSLDVWEMLKTGERDLEGNEVAEVRTVKLIY